MHVQAFADYILGQMDALLAQVDGPTYSRGLPVLSGASLGQHTRHIVEFFEAFERGVPTGKLCYDDRQRDARLETDTAFVRKRLEAFKQLLDATDLTGPITLVSKDQPGADDSAMELPSSVARELLYCIEHAIHHMAILRIGVEQALPQVQLPEDFGLAPSTVTYRKQLEQRGA